MGRVPLTISSTLAVSMLAMYALDKADEYGKKREAAEARDYAFAVDVSRVTGYPVYQHRVYDPSSIYFNSDPAYYSQAPLYTPPIKNHQDGLSNSTYTVFVPPQYATNVDVLNDASSAIASRLGQNATMPQEYTISFLTDDPTPRSISQGNWLVVPVNKEVSSLTFAP